jgi:nicotinate-nucleotide adenylyltransferase
VALSRAPAGGRLPVRGPLGILGGTFDPIHLAHLAIAEQAREDLGLREVVFIPAGTPPHKPGRPISPAEHRVAMVELAIAGNASFRVSRIEVDRSGPSYTIDTLRVLTTGDGGSAADGVPVNDIVLIVSAEALAAFPEWRKPNEVLDLARVAVVPRRGCPTPGRAWLEEQFPGRSDRFLFLAGPDLGHSASDIRARVVHGRSIRYLVPDAVEAYVRGHSLYSADEWRRAFAAPGAVP